MVTQEGVGTTTDKADKTEETVGGITNNVDAINGDAGGSRYNH